MKGLNWLKRLLGIGFSCPFLLLTGLYCPGCGGTRAVRSLLRGDLRMSFQYHPLVLYAILVFGFMLVWCPRDRKKWERFFILLGAVIVVVNWIFKNYMLVFSGVDLLPVIK